MNAKTERLNDLVTNLGDIALEACGLDEFDNDWQEKEFDRRVRLFVNRYVREEIAYRDSAER